MGSQTVNPSPTRLLSELLPESDRAGVKDRDVLRCALWQEAVGLVRLKQIQGPARFERIRPSFPGRVLTLSTVAVEGRLVPRWEARPVRFGVSRTPHTPTGSPWHSPSCSAWPSGPASLGAQWMWEGVAISSVFPSA